MQSNALFGDGYCEDSSEADNLAMTSRVRAGLTYYNFNNSPWTFSPSLGLNYDFYGNGASSLGGYVEDKMSMTFGSSFNSGGTTVSLNYVAELGDYTDRRSRENRGGSSSYTYQPASGGYGSTYSNQPRPVIDPRAPTSAMDPYTYNGKLKQRPSSEFLPRTADFSAFAK